MSSYNFENSKQLKDSLSQKLNIYLATIFHSLPMFGNTDRFQNKGIEKLKYNLYEITYQYRIILI
jgi:hypothetical protein